MIEKTFSLFGRQIFSKIERSRDGSVWTTLLSGDDFLNNSNYLKTSLENPVLNAIVSLRAKMYSQMQIIHIDASEKEVKNSDVLKLLKQPNYFQSQEDFLFQQMWFLSVAGNNYVYQIKPLSTDLPKAMYNLIPSEIDFNKINKVDKFIFRKEQIKALSERNIKYTLDGKTYDIKLSEIIPLYDLANALTTDSWFTAPSRVKAIEKVLQNIDVNLRSKHKNLQMSTKYVGVNKSTGMEAQIQKADQKEIERVLNTKDVLTTNASVEYKHLVSDMKKLFLDEQFADDANKCLLAFEMNKNVLNYFAKDSTFENQNQGIINWIQNSIQGSADNTMNSLSATFGLLEKGEKLVASFNHLPVMQTLINDKIKSLTEFQNALKVGLENQTIDSATAKKMTDNFIKDLGL
jgi:hypothetical protein